MKKVIIVFLTLFVNIVLAQTSHVINHGVPITVENGITITFQGNFINDSIGYIDNSGIITLPGNWTNNAVDPVFNNNTGKVSFLGTSPQTINGSNTTHFSKLTIDNLFGVTLNKYITVSDTLTLQSGKLSTTTNNILIMNNSSSNDVISYTSFVNGPMKKVGNTDYLFPVGKDSLTRPISIENISGSDTFNAEYFHFNPDIANVQDIGAPYSVLLKDTSLGIISNTEYWILNRSGTESAKVRLSWDTYSMPVTSLIRINVARWNDTLWKNEWNGGFTGVISPGRGTVISSNIISSFSPFTLAYLDSTNPLPIEILYFGAKKNVDVEVTWITLTETNNDYFVVERSFDGINFTILTTVDGAGNSNMLLNYQIHDKKYDRVVYYRLKQVDFDGKYTYSKVISIDEDEKNILYDITIYPNPTNFVDGVHIMLNNLDDVSIDILDVSGQIVSHKFINTSIYHYDFGQDLSTGIYFMRFTSDNLIVTHKLIIK